MIQRLRMSKASAMVAIFSADGALALRLRQAVASVALGAARIAERVHTRTAAVGAGLYERGVDGFTDA